MKDPERNPELMADLLGYHLGLADAETRASIEARFSKEELARSREAVQRIGRALDTDEAPEVPAGLAERVLSRVEAVHQRLPFMPAVTVRASGSEQGGSHRPLMRLREMVGLAAAILLFVGIFVPGYRTARLASEQAMCGNHLRQIGNGYAAYADMFGGQMPFTGVLPENVSWLQPSEAGVPMMGNSRDSFMLVQRRLVPPSTFICPGRTGDRPMDLREATAKALNGFPDPRNNSFSTQLMTGPVRSDQIDAETPIAADKTPLAEVRRARVLAGELPPNSRSHGQPGGQNVLHGNLSVRFVRNPNVGVDNDDIYRLIGVQEYTGRERPTLRSDAFLIP
jgi:hypothetical protein